MSNDDPAQPKTSAGLATIAIGAAVVWGIVLYMRKVDAEKRDEAELEQLSQVIQRRERADAENAERREALHYARPIPFHF